MHVDHQRLAVVRASREGMSWRQTMSTGLTRRLFFILCILPHVHCFSAIGISTLLDIRSAILASDADDGRNPTNDATSVPFHAIIEQQDDSASTDRSTSLIFSSDFIPRQEISLSKYNECTKSRHNDCRSLFDGYSTEIKRCESIDEKTLNMRWRATWIPAGSTWLYNLANLCGWNIESRSADPSKVSAFSWQSIFSMFSKAFATGNITLPISKADGNTIVTIQVNGAISIRESLDLTKEADAGRLLNRRVAQEFSAWLDVSRRPDECGINEDEWAGMVRERTLIGVPGAGSLDVDPNENDGEGAVALLIFGAFCSAALALSFQYFVAPEIVGGTGAISALCDDAERIEFGSGYLSECFGPYGDGPFVR